MARGSVRRHDNGWGYRVDLGPDPATGKRRQVSKQGFRTKREAEQAAQAVLKSAAEGAVTNRTNRTVGDYLDEWLQMQQPRLRATTHHSYAMAVNRIKSGLGSAKMQSLTPLQVERFYRELTSARLGRDYSPKTIRNTHTVLRKALADAERLELVIRNAAAAARPPAVDHKDRVTWSSEELGEFLESVRDDRLYPVFVVLATTGMRRGEVLGLRWRDVDFDAGDLAIANTRTPVKSEIVTGPPKTARSRRQVFLDDWTIDVLRAQRRAQAADRLAAGPVWSAVEDYVFTDEVGVPLNPNAVSKRFDTIVRKSGLPRIRLHDLRHTYATVALKAGVHPKVVSERLGHATVGITLDLYSHVTPSIARDAADVVASKIRR